MMTVHETITLEDQISKIAALIPQGYRLVTMTAVDSGDHFDIYYHFDRNYELLNLKLELAKDAELPSITEVCPCAFVIENEIQDLLSSMKMLRKNRSAGSPACRCPQLR